LRLLKLSINGEYRSLSDFSWEFRGSPVDFDKMEPVCLVGLNGSGKSNLIEALSEIFCFLDLSCLEYVSDSKTRKIAPPPFMVEYYLASLDDSGPTHVRIRYTDKKKLVVCKEVDGDFVSIDDKAAWRDFLPDRIVGYSSGHNETVSIPYLRNQSLYSVEVTHQAISKKGDKDKLIEHTSSIYMDYDSNASILLSNYLFPEKEKLAVFEKFLRVSDMASFSVVLNLKPRSSVVKLTSELEEIIEKLKRCAFSVTNVNKNESVLNFIVNEASKAAFKKNFLNSSEFYMSMYKLSLLNSLSLSKKEREFYLRSDLKNGLLERPPSVSGKDKVFSVKDLRLTISEPEKEVDYSGISDGEHQFIHIFGTLMLFSDKNCLYLLDEPESHFNPLWRAEFIRIMAGIESTSSQDFVISTHSPFLVSAAHSDNVIKFSRRDGVINPQELDFQCFGSSFEYLLAKLFDLNTPIAAQALEELKLVSKSDNLEEVRLSISKFGESLEKRFLHQRIAELEARER